MRSFCPSVLLLEMSRFLICPCHDNLEFDHLIESLSEYQCHGFQSFLQKCCCFKIDLDNSKHTQNAVQIL